MKKLIAIGIFVLMVSSLANAQTSFTIKPGLNFNGASSKLIT